MKITYLCKLKAINVRDDKHISYALEICKGNKLIETRNTNSLKSLVNRRIRIIRTIPSKKSMVVGEVTVVGIKEYDSLLNFNKDKGLHLVEETSNFAFSEKKYGYILENAILYKNSYPPINTGMTVRNDIRAPYQFLRKRKIQS